MNKEKRWVLMHDGTPQMEYLGKTDLTDEEISAVNKVTLEECRCLRTLIIPGPEGITQSNMLTSNSVARGGITLRIKPTAWWWPEEDPHAMEVINKQLRGCEANELASRAKESGLVTATGNPVSEEIARQIKERLSNQDGFKGRP